MKIKLNQYFDRFQAFIRKALFPWSGHSKLGIGFLCIGLCIGVVVRVGMLWFVDYRFDAGDGVGYLSGAHNLLEYHIFSLDENTPRYQVSTGLPSILFL